MDRRRVLAVGAASLIAAHLPMGRVHAQGEGPVALITGCSSGFGRLTALTMARAGYRVAASMRGHEAANAEAARALRAVAADEGLELIVPEIDVRSDASVLSGVAETEQAFGPVDVLISNAGIGIPLPAELSMDATREVIETNLFGGLRMVRAVAPSMRERGTGLIVQTSSALGRYAMPTYGAYTASKHALEALFHALAFELHPFGVETAILQPGGYDTLFKENAVEDQDRILSSLPPEDAARLTAYERHVDVARSITESYPTDPPQEIADALLALAEMPRGERPLRVATGPGTAGLSAINEPLERTAEQIARGLGVEDWTTLG